MPRHAMTMERDKVENRLGTIRATLTTTRSMKGAPMSRTGRHPRATSHGIRKAPTGVKGLDEVTRGASPAGRPTLVCGNAGCGKTLLAMEFLVRGATRFNEPGVFITFEET